MLSEFKHPDDLLTPIIIHDGVNSISQLFTSTEEFSVDDNNIYFSSIPSKLSEYELVTKDNTNENSDNKQQEQDDLFSTFDFPVLSELSKTDLQFDDLQLDKYVIQSSCQSLTGDIHDSLLSDDSVFLPVDESTSMTSSWVGEECVIESKNIEDMMVPPSPTVSSESGSTSISSKKSSRRKNLSITDRKSRKKDQNKAAAEKYRVKKRAERDELITRHLKLKNQNQELKHELESLTLHLEHMKQLFVDVLQIQIPSTK